MSWLEPGAGDEFRLSYAEWQRERRWGTPIAVAAGKELVRQLGGFPVRRPGA